MVTQEAFDRMLAWLDEDRDKAGNKYEDIRKRLIKIFLRRGCPLAEELTDETINRVTKKISQIGDTYEGDPALYFYGVAHNVYLEYVKKRPAPLPIPEPDSPETRERNYACLEQCMEKLSPENRELIIEYYKDEKQAKINQRKELARQMGITLNTLRMRAHRIKAGLQECVLACVERKQADWR